jgi:serine/threonine protein kinase
MEGRYEIREKIGQGGLGAVFRGYDTRMNREVAIKRISATAGDPEMQEESTRQLIKEAGALASLQHPHIVTIHDVGSDEEGPYVVMELISGKTLDELIERAPLTWSDFRELAMQTQEALIAAQELDLIHSDLKPSNLMLTWLPSGKFQVKIVDFGLATLARSQSKQEMENMDSVFGSIFFMAPEQFERSPLDARLDLYSIGCVYYQALAGAYPFDGKTGMEVMNAHLQHSVTPLQELRSDIPMWACDWIMWHLNRLPQDRPESARQSLSVFLQNDKNPNPTMSLGSAQPANVQKRPRLIIPGFEPTPTAGSIPMAIPVGIPAGIPVAQAALRSDGAIAVAVVASLAPDPIDIPESTKTKSAPQPLTPPQGSKPSVHTAPQDIPEAVALTPAAPPATAAQPSAVQLTPARIPKPEAPPPPLPQAPAPVGLPHAKRKLPNAAKSAIAAILGLFVVLVAWYLLDRRSRNREAGIYNEMMAIAAKPDATELTVNAEKLTILLNSAANVAANTQRITIYKALYLAKASDATDVDARIAEFATRSEMLPEVREVLIRDVLRKRKNPAVVPILMDFARTTNEPRAAVAALQSVRFMAGDEQFDKFLEVIQATSKDEVRKAAEETFAEIIKKSANRADFARRLATAFETSTDENIRHAMLRLLGRCGGTRAMEIVKKTLDSTEPKNQIAAIIALGSWGDDSGFPLLTEKIGGTRDEQIRSRAFDSALKYVTDSDLKHPGPAWQEQWTQLSSLAKTRTEQEKIIRGLVNVNQDWAFKLNEGYTKSTDDGIVDLAEKAIDRMRERKLIQGEDK